ncbi:MULTISPECIES: 50S ribosomal protein L11 methyltransferase [Idiomarina]|jgi:ribosomal protein L11 methyltransferase|uniref:50S ribosomal protein L11 methyltransferase n=1 Tax=Idiomarina TaxID=135575 RepID=UPI000C46690F|nr:MULTISPECIES: 50S ribosomal protein L11 methyltransferase [Idiomarina]MAO67000.1 50S ribosomal protein L11 methyltransferase [Idiomarina sp.]MBF81323.1 50S ribosomal protein L11 methyltransferase [Idiomarina sp.]|tara:strand:+ start:223 stop:1104 length:882 start_codon:yes stop_codon:yes gene_type:complete
MPWIQLTLSCSEEHAPQVGDMLMANGAQAVTYRDGADTPIFEPRPGDVILWEHTLATGLFDAEADIKAIIANLKQSNVFDSDLQYKVDPLEDKDWEREWMDNFHPIRFGEQLWICPSWRDIPDPSAVNILLDPGMAFGTGTHPTTAMCLRWLDANPPKGKSTLDFGCGSGILGIAALLFNAKHAIGIDIDQQALIATKDNAARNGVINKFDVFLPSEQPQTQVDLVLANVLAGPLRELSDTILAFVKPGGQLVLSGILERQVGDVMAAYQPDITFDTPVIDGDWAMLSGTRVG